MNTIIPQTERAEPPASAAGFVLPFEALDRAALAIAGGKAANLGELTRAGLPVPPGFCVTTDAYAAVAAGAGLEPVLAEIAATPAGETARLAELAAQARERLLAAPVPEEIATAVREAYAALGAGTPVAVRSSATAEDLPGASFAGQQDTYLNITGAEAVLDAVRRCWASLWTDRAVAYRAANAIDPHGVRLAVAVQRLVDSRVAGVLFTANPLTGRRRQAVIDASPGLGEAIVSGAVNPDHFVVDTGSGRILERRLGDKRVAVRSLAGGGTERVELPEGSAEACLTDDQVRALAALGGRVEAHYGAPQDTEWAFDAAGVLWLTQSRPITTLFPLPAGAPDDDRDLRVYFSVNVAQGVYRPLTPMGVQTFRLMAAAIGGIVGAPPPDPVAGPRLLSEAAGRLFIDFTPILRSAIGAAIVRRMLRFMEARTAALLDPLAADSRLAPRPARPGSLFRVLWVLLRTGVPWRTLQAVVRPAAARARAQRALREVIALADLPPSARAAERLDAFERLIRTGLPLLFDATIALVPAGMGAYALAGALLGKRATAAERETVLRGLPHNPTTEMDLALWALAERFRAEPEAARALRETPVAQLAESYRAGALPVALQDGLIQFLDIYGHRGVAEIDLGLSRWSEDPTHILGVLANYLRLENPDQAPDAQFRKAAAEAEAMVAALVLRARRRSPLHGALVAFLLSRTRALGGQRELPKFAFVLLFAQGRRLLAPVGEELARAGRLERAEDIFFLDLPEARAALAGADQRPLVRRRRSDYQQELGRRHLPRLLLSDGREPAPPAPSVAAGNALRGAPASAGEVTAPARVILDPTGAHLEPGEILVAPSTDPGWTPLFLTAGGLVMEMGGAMSHGAVVAREYGIPAVVGVPAATERIRTGQRITVDGGAGLVQLTPEPDNRPASQAKAVSAIGG
jgi:pyruvate,water dikinase